MPKLIRGLSAFPITPQSADGVVDAPALRHLVHRLINAEVESIGLLGSTGTYAFLSRAERRRAIQVAVDCIADAKKKAAAGAADADGGQGGGGGMGSSRKSWPILLVSVSHVRTDRAIALARDALECGADAGLLSPISYNPLTEREVAAHYAAVASAVPGLPLVIYDNPGTTKFSFSPALVGRLARELPSVVGLKTSSPATQVGGQADISAGTQIGRHGAGGEEEMQREGCIRMQHARGCSRARGGCRSFRAEGRVSMVSLDGRSVVVVVVVLMGVAVCAAAAIEVRLDTNSTQPLRHRPPPTNRTTAPPQIRTRRARCTRRCKRLSGRGRRSCSCLRVRECIIRVKSVGLPTGCFVRACARGVPARAVATAWN
jgi:hypothetical protein